MVLAAIAAVFAVVSVGIAVFIGPRRYNRAKLEPYGAVSNRRSAGPGSEYRVKFYLTAMLFIIFDIEIVFLYPWAVAVDQLAWFGLLAVGLFIVNVSIAYAYEWRRGGLSWE